MQKHASFNLKKTKPKTKNRSAIGPQKPRWSCLHRGNVRTQVSLQSPGRANPLTTSHHPPATGDETDGGASHQRESYLNRKKYIYKLHGRAPGTKDIK